MKLYDLNDKDRKLMTLDLFSLMGLHDLPQNEKDDLAREITTLAFQNFLGNKAELYLTEAEMNDLMDRHPLNDEKDAEEFLREIALKIPGSERMLVDAILETKAYMIKQQYVTKYKVFSQMYQEERDEAKQKEYLEVMEDSKRRLEVIEAGNWELLIL